MIEGFTPRTPKSNKVLKTEPRVSCTLHWLVRFPYRLRWNWRFFFEHRPIERAWTAFCAALGFSVLYYPRHIRKQLREARTANVTGQLRAQQEDKP